MSDEASRTEVAAAIDRINRAWRERRPTDLVPLFHPGLTTAFPGFAGRAEGRDANIAGFEDFCAHAVLHEYREADNQIDVVADTAVATFTFEMVYQRGEERTRATGRDLWVFRRQDGHWLAVWRTMLDLVERPA